MPEQRLYRRRSLRCIGRGLGQARLPLLRLGSAKETALATMLLQLYAARGQCGLCQAPRGLPVKESPDAVRMKARGAACLPSAPCLALDSQAPERLDGFWQHPSAHFDGDCLRAAAVPAVLCSMGMPCCRACSRRCASIV